MPVIGASLGLYPPLEKSLLGLGEITLPDITDFFSKVVVPLFGIGAQVYATYSSYQLREEALKLEKEKFEFQKAQALLQYAMLKEEFEAQEKAKENVLGVPYGNVMLLGAGVVVLLIVLVGRR